jgi:hypothetical protein
MATTDSWPQAREYLDAVQTPQVGFTDSRLKAATIAMNAIGMPLAVSGRSAIVFRATTGGADVALRFFTRAAPGYRRRYQELQGYLAGSRPSYLVDFAYHDSGIFVGGMRYPMVEMMWVTGDPLDEWVDRCLRGGGGDLAALAAKWLEVVTDLERRGIAHGDFANGNCLVSGHSPTLVDYDGFFLPSLADTDPGEAGSPHFQHPGRPGYYASNMDAFPALVIYLSLVALESDRSLWRRYHRGDNLIFRADDYLAPWATSIWRDLASNQDPGVRRLTAALADMCKASVESLPPLRQIVGYRDLGEPTWWQPAAPETGERESRPPAARPPAGAGARGRAVARWPVRLWRGRRARQQASPSQGQHQQPTAPAGGDRHGGGLGDGSSPRSAGEIQPVEVNVSADMPSHVLVGKIVSVACHVSREEIDAAVGRTRDEGRVTADAARLITLDLLPRANAEVAGEDRAEVPVPDEGQTSDAYFDIRPTHPGKCQVWVVVRQGPVPLLTLRLEAAAAPSWPAGPAVRQPVEARVGIGRATGLEDASWLSVAEMDRGRDTVYRFDLRSTTLGILATYESPPLRHRTEYVANLYREIEDRWITSAGDVEAFQEELREFGGSLLSQLFPEQLQAVLWRHRESLQNLIVLSCEPFIPWELVHLKEPGGPLPDETRFLAEMGLVRWLYTRGDAYPPETLHARPGRVRILCPDYPDPDLHLSHTRGEAQFLTDHLGGSMIAANEYDVRALLRDGSFDILHFAGHGMADSDDIANAKILLEGRRESGVYIRSYLSATTVAQQARLTSSDGAKPLVVLNACQAGRLGQQMSSLGGFAQAFLDRGAGAFVSSMWSVGDEPASTFVKTLYQELLDQEPISAAVSRARQKARRAGDGTWLAYAVYAHPKAHLLLSTRLRYVTGARSGAIIRAGVTPAMDAQHREPPIKTNIAPA